MAIDKRLWRTRWPCVWTWRAVLLSKCLVGALEACSNYKTNHSVWNLSRTDSSQASLPCGSLVLRMARAVASCGRRWPRTNCEAGSEEG